MIQSLQDGAHNAVNIMERGRDKANTSVERSRAAELSLTHITESVLRLSDMNVQIATAVEQQSAVTDDIARNIEAIRSVATRSVEAARDSKKTGVLLTAQADNLQKEVAHFKV